MNITDEIKNKILQNLDIIDIIGDAVELRKKGNNYWGLCPFHNEKSASFSVSADKGIYKCFGCGVSGNVITFQMEYYRMTFPEAIKELAAKAGVYIEDKPYTPEQKEKITNKELALKALTASAEFFRKMLFSTGGKHALSYFQKREFSQELLEKFILGYSPDSWDALLKELRKQNFTDSALIEAGLVIQKEDSDIYDRFRNRAMFPIHDHLGNIVGFGARHLDDEIKQAKYINSPQTIVYDKSSILYGLFHSKDEIRKKGFAILTEGYADVLSLHQGGYKNSIASSGTSLTKEQLINLYRYCKSIYIVYDADTAGIKAAERGLEMALEHGFNVMIVTLPQGEDPDSIIRNLGARNFQVYLDEAVPFLDYLVSHYKNEGKLDNPLLKSEAVRTLISIISKIPDKLQHDDYISHLASLMNLSERQVEQIYKEKSNHEKKSKSAQSVRVGVRGSVDKSVIEQKSILKQESIDENSELQEKLLPEEDMLIQLALSDKNAYNTMKDEFKLLPENLHTNLGKNLLAHIYRLWLKHEDIVKALFDDNKLSESEKNILSSMIFHEKKQSDNWNKYSNRIIEKDIKRIIKDVLIRLDLISLDEKRAVLNNKLKDESSLVNQLTIMKELQILAEKVERFERLLIR